MQLRCKLNPRKIKHFRTSFLSMPRKLDSHCTGGKIDWSRLIPFYRIKDKLAKDSSSFDNEVKKQFAQFCNFQRICTISVFCKTDFPLANLLVSIILHFKWWSVKGAFWQFTQHNPRGQTAAFIFTSRVLSCSKGDFHVFISIFQHFFAAKPRDDTLSRRSRCCRVEALFSRLDAGRTKKSTQIMMEGT